MQQEIKIAPKYNKRVCDALPKFDRGVSWLGWAYNEEKLIANYLTRANELLKETVEDYEIIIVDDGSTDRTNEIIKELMRDIPEIRLVRNRANMNVGYSSKRAVESAGKEYLFWQTVDWSYDISCLRIFLELLTSYDVVAGVRREPVKAVDSAMKPVLGVLKLFGMKHITRRSDTIVKAIISVINYILIRCLFNVPLSDYQNVVFYPTRLVQGMPFEARSSFGNPEFLLKAYWKGCSIVEVPISFLPREIGEAKGTRPKAIMSSVIEIFSLWFKWIILRQREVPQKGLIKRLNPDEWGDQYECASKDYETG